MKKVKISRPILVDHVARIEGKAGIEVKILDSKVSTVRMNIFEGPRFFESITVGKKIEDAVAVFPRICSFCAAAHKITSVIAAEDALGIEVSDQTRKLRELLYIGDFIESHALHLFFLAFPDLLGYPDALSMTEEFEDIVKAGISLKDVGAKIQTIIGSRYIHQENVQIGGFGKIPTKEEINELENNLTSVEMISQMAVEILLNFDTWKELDKDRNHLAIKCTDGEYTMMGNTVTSDDGIEFPAIDYRKHILEHVVSHSFAKHSAFRSDPGLVDDDGVPFMTSALSRFTINGKEMPGRGRELALMHKNYLDPSNPLSNNFAQAVELVHFVDRARSICQDLAETIDPDEPKMKYDAAKGGVGVAISEAPRGMLAYTLEIGKDGRIRSADVITPTAMFLPLMEDDVGRMAQALIDQGINDSSVISQKLETVVRAYDPCVSCSVHVTTVR